MLRGVRLIEELRCRQGTKAPMLEAVPDIVVSVDEHAPRPETKCAAANQRRRQHCTRRGDQGVVPNSHRGTPFSVVVRDAASGGRYPHNRYHVTVCAIPIDRSVAAVNSSSREALETSYTRLCVRNSSRLRVSGTYCFKPGGSRSPNAATARAAKNGMRPRGSRVPSAHAITLASSRIV